MDKTAPGHPNLEATKYWTTHTKMRLEAVCARAGIKITMLSKIKRGHTYPSAPTAIALEEASRHYAEVPNDFMRAEELLELRGRVEQRERNLRSAA